MHDAGTCRGARRRQSVGGYRIRGDAREPNVSILHGELRLIRYKRCMRDTGLARVISNCHRIYSAS